ncbi:MAG: glutamate decarboxylase [Pseudohongiellaceae bacterium]|nr:glutamate decarboxylase [Pseudohongiellaceae bacterium]
MEKDHSAYKVVNNRNISLKLSKYELPETGMSAHDAYQLVKSELQTQGNPALNMASFVTTIMDKECDDLIHENLGVNFIDTEVYRGNLEVHDRCVKILGNLFGAPDVDKVWGTQCVGSSEALMLALLAHKRAWQKRRKAEGKPYDKPNIVMGNDVHLTWIKAAIYFEVEQKIIPLQEDRFTVTAEEVLERVDENTICVVGVLGTSYTFDYDPIEEINAALVSLKKEKSLDIPLHVDGASGAFIAPFLNPEIKWDFQLEQVKTINTSGHKYGLVYPGIGWALWRDEDDIPKELVTETNVLGFVEKSFSLNFSRGGSMILAQYYNFLRLGKQGYTRIMEHLRDVAQYLASELQQFEELEVLRDGRYTPSVILKLKSEERFNAADLVAALAQHGWIVPAFSLPANADKINVMRLNVKEEFNGELADRLVADFRQALDKLSQTHQQPFEKLNTEHPK